MSVISVLLQLLACLGAGAIGLRALGLHDGVPARERPLWAFALGLGVLGWLVFPLVFVEWASLVSFLLIELALAAGCLGLWRDLRERVWPRPGQWTWSAWTLASVALVAVAFDLAEALAPPLDADSLAYHFILARDIARAGRIEFIPRAIDGAGAFLLQMTYVPPLALGGERGLTLWTMASGWAAPLFLYAVARRWLEARWSAAAALLLATVPAWLYGAGSGQVEPRLALFAFAGLLAAAEARRTGSLRHAALAGLMAGFYAGGKFSGLFFVAAAGSVVVWRNAPWRPALVFAAAVAGAGFQWYAWNYVMSGDPVFPGLFAVLGVRDPALWNEALEAAFRESLTAERPAGPGWVLLFTYPFAASLGLGPPIWDAGRTGLGPYGLLVLPFALAGLWRFRDRACASPLFGVALGVLIFYVLWILAGPSQRVRHFIPLFPAFLLCAMVAAARFAAPRYGSLLAAAVATSLAVHLGAGVLFALPYLRFQVSGETRESFLERHLIGYAAAKWVNAHLAPSDRILITERHLNYHLDPPAFYVRPSSQAQVDLRPGNRDMRGQWTTLRRRNITHVLLVPGLSSGHSSSGLFRLARALVDSGCAEVAATIPVRDFVSRTLPAWRATTVPADVLRLWPDRCNPERLPAG
jgi:hypothetical protein